MDSKIKLGVAPIAWTNDDMPELGKDNSFKQSISEMALAGYIGTEIGSKFPSDVEEIKSELAIRGLQICNQWFSTFLLSQEFRRVERDFRAQLERLSFLGAKIIGLSEQSNSIQGEMNTPLFADKPTFTAEEWNSFASGLNRLGKIARDEYDITLTYHHHMGTGCQTQLECDTLLDATDSRYVSLLYDSGHFAFSGEDPLEMFNRYKERIRHIHLKDLRAVVASQAKKESWSFLQAVRKGVFTVPSDGSVDFKSLLTAIKASGYQGWMVVEAEQDPAIADPFVYSQKAYRYISELLGNSQEK